MFIQRKNVSVKHFVLCVNNEICRTNCELTFSVLQNNVYVMFDILRYMCVCEELSYVYA